MTSTPPRAPEHLRAETRQWWEQVVADFELEPHHHRLLTLAAEAWDRCMEAREALARDGAYQRNRFGELKVHPAVAVERDSRIAYIRAMRELSLDTDPPAETPRPPYMRGYRDA